jgi:hypothetical protein
MNEGYFPIEFSHGETQYEGRVTPERKANHHTSYHVVLNEVFFGYVHKHDEHWHVSEQRPASLVQKVGECIEKVYPAASV